MNFNSLVWYSSLAIGDEKNSYVADFLNRSCELLNEEINQEIKEKKLPINFKIDFLHIPKGEEGVGLLNNKLTGYTNPVFTNSHSIPKYNPSIVENIKDKSFFYFPQNVTSSSYDKFDENVKIMKKIKQKDYVIALDSQGESIDSIKFSNLINSSETYINKEIVFVIGGSEGLDKNIIARADKVLSFSKLTFQHQIVRLLLIEQIYRAKKIQENHPYHK